MKIERFPMNSSTCPLSKSVGCIIFLKSSKLNLTQWTETYAIITMKNFYDFVNGIRKLRNLEVSKGCEPSSKMTVVPWCDGGIDHITSILSKKVSIKEKLHKIIQNKHSPKRTSREAAFDLTNSFKSIKKVPMH